MPAPLANRPEVDLPSKERYTYDDYQQLPEGAPYELIHGHLVMSPSPTFQHQDIVLRLASALRDHARSGPKGEVSIAPMDVRLTDDTVVQPDVLYVAPDRVDQIKEQEIDGPPTLIVEVASPSTSHLDAFDKKQLYESHGVREYWIVDPETETVEVYTAGDEGYILHQRRVAAGTTASALLDDFSVDLEDLFREGG
ncbi:MAG: Uma2 family endonuclease [Salinivenus sp.]